jgi:hypothetical protein
METRNDNVAALLEDEWLLVRNSGETPEIALHSALYYLTVSEEGPRLTLSEHQIGSLRCAATERFLEIIVRDLQHVNYGTPGYRGIQRSIINYRRFCAFCKRQKIERMKVQGAAAEALLRFLEIEVKEVEGMPRTSIINCSFETLETFAADLKIDVNLRFPGLGKLCIDAE